MSFNIAQAGNWIKEKFKKGIRKTAKEDTKHMLPSVATGEDRTKYLRYCISLLKDVPSPIMHAIPVQLRMANGLSSKQLAKFMRYFMIVKLENSDEWVAKNFNIDARVVKTFEGLCMKAAKECIRRRKLEGVPIVGM